jgi:hypothetical protein
MYADVSGPARLVARCSGDDAVLRYFDWRTLA